MRRTQNNNNRLYNIEVGSGEMRPEHSSKPADRTDELLSSEGLEDVVATTLLYGRAKNKSVSYSKRFDGFVKERNEYASCAKKKA